MESNNSLIKIKLLVFFLAVASIAVYLFAISNAHNFGSISSSNTNTIELTTETLTANEARIIEIVSGHAWQQHGDEVNSAIKCLSNNGTLKSFRTSGFTDDNNRHVDANVWLCFDGNDYFAIVTTKFIKDGGNQIARLVTAYKVAKDVFPTIEDFITYIATKWSAYEISYVIKAGEQIFLSAR
jgi:hypothetical protein